jgi:predicted dehydrogenase
MRVGIVGAGVMGQTHAAAWRQLGVDGLVVHERHSDHLAAFVASTGAQPATTLDALVSSVDLVDVCTPTPHHRDAVLAAAAAGRHVVCEKPIARTIADAEAMIAACRGAGVRFFVAHVVRYFPDYVAAQAQVAAGRIGRPAIVRLRRESFRPQDPGHWLFDERASGGVILDLMVHDFDYARWICGEVESVMARTVRDASGGEVDYAVALLRHASGALSHLTGAWAYPPPVFRTGFEVAGDGGLIEYESLDQEPIARYLLADHVVDSAKVGLPSSPTDDDPYLAELADFLRAIETGSEPRVSPEDGLAALRIGLAAIESSRTGQPVVPASVA